MDMPDLVEHAFRIYDGISGRIGLVANPDVNEEDEDEGTDPGQDASAAEVGVPNGHEVPEGHDVPDDSPVAAHTENQSPPPVAVPHGTTSPSSSDNDEDDDVLAMEADLNTERELLEESSRTPLYAGAKLTQLSSTLLLLNCLRTHGASNLLVNELFQLLSKSILPDINSLPHSEYSASKILKQLGLAYNTIHVCPGPGACMLFRGPVDSLLDRCAKCGTARYRKVGKSKIPCKVLRHFPLIPRLQRMFSTPLQASFMTAHARLASTDDAMRGAYDSHQWKFINWRWWHDFAKEDRNLRLGLATDGVNPFSIKRSTHSTWPVLIFNYNLPPWLATKKHFVILSLIIPGKRSVTGECFDTYLQPLVEELQLLWSEGVRTEDAAAYKGSSSFIMKAMLMWTSHDFPAYGLVAGCVTKGYKGCPICGKNTISRRSVALKKNVYDSQYRRWLPEGHPWRTNGAAFNGEVELRGPPEPIQVAEILRWGQLREAFTLRGGIPKVEDPARTFGIKRVSALYSLPYWSVSSLNSFYLYVVVVLSCCYVSLSA